MTKYDALPAFLAAMRPFAWGENDCCTVAADWLMERGYPDPMEVVRGKYDSAVAAREFMRTGFEALVTEQLGPPLPNPKFAQRGDIAVVEWPNGRQAVGIVTAEGVAGPGATERILVPLELIVAAWRVA